MLEHLEHIFGSQYQQNPVSVGLEDGPMSGPSARSGQGLRAPGPQGLRAPIDLTLKLGS